MASKAKEAHRTSSIDPAEAAHFAALAADWWNPKGSSAMLHRLNPPRLTYIRAAIDRHWSGDPRAMRPLAGKRALDVGCGAGLITEPLARMGAGVTGIDAAAENIAAAISHARDQGLAIDYRAVGIEALEQDGFDLVTSLEVIEHVREPAAFVQALAQALAPDGLMILSTPNRTALSKLALVTLGEGTGAIPRGTHDWDKFIPPDALEAMLKAAGMEVVDVTGLAFGPVRGFHLSQRTGLNYLMTARRAKA